MQDRYVGLMGYLGEALDECGHFRVVARREQEGESSQPDPHDLPVIEVTADESDNEICLIRSSAIDKDASIPDFKTFYEALVFRLNQHPDYSLRVSEYFQIDDEHTGRLDRPLAGAEVVEAQQVVRLFF